MHWVQLFGMTGNAMVGRHSGGVFEQPMKTIEFF